ncbi:hypothetical protein D3C81_2293950 [compost metagenome]
MTTCPFIAAWVCLTLLSRMDRQVLAKVYMPLLRAVSCFQPSSRPLLYASAVLVWARASA